MRMVAVMFVDALRYELGQELHQALDEQGAGDQRELFVRLAVIPTVTALGMVALLPGGDRRMVDYDDGWDIVIGDSANLKY